MSFKQTRNVWENLSYTHTAEPTRQGALLQQSTTSYNLHPSFPSIQQSLLLTEHVQSFQNFSTYKHFMYPLTDLPFRYPRFVLSLSFFSMKD